MRWRYIRLQSPSPTPLHPPSSSPPNSNPQFHNPGRKTSQSIRPPRKVHLHPTPHRRRPPQTPRGTRNRDRVQPAKATGPGHQGIGLRRHPRKPRQDHYQRRFRALLPGVPRLYHVIVRGEVLAKFYYVLSLIPRARALLANITKSLVHI